VALDDPLDVEELVGRQQEEPAWVRAHSLVLLAAEFDELVAAQPRALTRERQPTGVAPRLIPSLSLRKVASLKARRSSDAPVIRAS